MVVKGWVTQLTHAINFIDILLRDQHIEINKVSDKSAREHQINTTNQEDHPGHPCNKQVVKVIKTLDPKGLTISDHKCHKQGHTILTLKSLIT